MSERRVITVRNSDRIGILGDSYTESHFSIRGKAYINKLSLFSDYQFENFAVSGDIYKGNVNRIREHTVVFGPDLSWADFAPRYAMLVSYTNDMKFMSNEAYADCLRLAVEPGRALGAEPIICTEYHQRWGRGIGGLFRQVAREYGCRVFDILEAVEQTRGEDYEPFWGGTHPGTRTNCIFSDNFGRCLDTLPRPTQSLKLFRLRSGVQVDSLDDLRFRTREERAALFAEIMVGHSALKNAADCDQCTQAPNGRVPSEYCALMAGKPVSVGRYALLSSVLPATAPLTDGVRLRLSASSPVRVYVCDALARPFVSATRYQRFDVGEGSFEVGTRLHADTFPGQEFTVVGYADGTLYCTPFRGMTGGGSLTLADTDAPYAAYEYAAVGFEIGHKSGKERFGHYVELSPDDDGYALPSELLSSAFDYDRVDFLIESPAGENELGDFEVIWEGTPQEKPLPAVSLARPYGDELMPYPLFSESSFWHATPAKRAEAPEDGCCPPGVSRVLTLGEGESVEADFTLPGSADERLVRLSVIARLFPPIGSGMITEDSYDYEKLHVTLYVDGRTAIPLSDLVSLHYKRCDFTLPLPASPAALRLRLHIEGSPRMLQLARASLRLLPYLD